MPRHFAYPFHVTPRGVATVEQHTATEVHGCCLVILHHTHGDRWEDHDFGIPDRTFTTTRDAASEIERALQRLEPRAEVVLTLDPASLITQAGITITAEAASG